MEERAAYVARICCRFHVGLERRLDLFLHELFKVDVLGKERVRLDRLCARDAEPLLRVAREEARQERARVGRDLVAEAERVGQDLHASAHACQPVLAGRT